MSAKAACCRVVRALLGSALVVALPSAHADTVTLTTGVSVTGNLVAAPSANGAKTVAMRTSTGGLIVFQKSDVKHVTHGTARGQKSSAVAGGAASHKLTAAEQAWIPRIRLLVTLLIEGDRDQSRRAKAQLLKIQDPSAIPALNRHLANTPDLEAQRLYVSMTKRAKGSARRGSRAQERCSFRLCRMATGTWPAARQKESRKSAMPTAMRFPI
jgi:hypothetical protein